MRSAVLGLALVLGPAVMAADVPLDSLVHYKIPAHWVKGPGSVGGDEFLSFTQGPKTIRVQLLGGKNSRYANPRDFLASPEARGENGEPARRARMMSVAGRRAWLYRRSWLRSLGDASGMGSGPTETVSEEFCIIPWGKKFFVLTYSVIQADDRNKLFREDKAWIDFLKNFRITRTPRHS